MLQSNIKSIRKEQTTADDKKVLQKHLGKLPVAGFGDLYDRFAVEAIDEFALMYDGAGIDVSDYTADIRINADDAAIILSDTPEKTAQRTGGHAGSPRRHATPQNHS